MTCAIHLNTDLFSRREYHIQGTFTGFQGDTTLVNQYKVKAYAKLFFLKIFLGETDLNVGATFSMKYHWRKLPLQNYQRHVFQICKKTFDSTQGHVRRRDEVVYTSSAAQHIETLNPKFNNL